ncbi:MULTISPECIES: restriction endonuclease subunit S [Exiguobacterium]|uniref:restriction endonuclease subunit S n=1 Tax=Exiguobacterium sp. UBA1053 TaxID=1946487 RepID=UPI0025B9F57F|nr:MULTISPECIES: restriction endonuclease subunit S [Exiguobacterium]
MKNKTVPEIRYKNIEDEWNLIKLSNLMNFSNGINAPKESYGRGRKMISVMDILSEERIEYKKIRNSVEVKESIESKNKVENGDLIFVRSSEVRNEVGWAKAYLQEQYALHSGFTIRGKKQNEYDAKFIECSLNYRNRYQIESKAGGSTRYNVGQEILKNVEIYIPSLKEQLLISTLIQNIENKINLHQQELDALKQTKQGFLQKMFPEEGMTIPEIRFPEFHEQWELKTLGEVLDSIYNGQTPSRNRKDFWNGNINWLSSGELNRGVVKTTIEKITEFGQRNANLKIVPQNTFVIAITGLEAAGTRGNCAILGMETTLNQSCMALFPKKNLLDTTFLFQWYRKVGENYGLKFTQGTKQQSYNAEIIKKLEICLPSVEEQVKIGEFFKQLDEVIEMKEKELEALKETKKGFLQKMFV